MPTMCRLVTLLTLASAVSRSVAYEEPDCPLRTDVHFAKNSTFDTNLPLTFGGGIVVEMTLTTPKSYSSNARLFSFSNYGNDTVQMSVAYGGYIFFGVGRGSADVTGITSRDAYNGKTFTVRGVILPGSTADSTTGQCFLYFNNVLQAASSNCQIPTFVERRANFIGHTLAMGYPTFQGTVANFALKACNVTPSVPTPLPSPQCLLRTDVHFAKTSTFDTNLPLTFGGGIVVEMTVTAPTTYANYARLFSFSKHGEDVVQMSVSYGGYIFFGVGQGSSAMTGITSRFYDYGGKTFTVRGVILPGRTADSTTGQCFLYFNNVLQAASANCQIPTFVERRANFIGYDLSPYPTFQGTVADFSMRSCNGSVDTSAPSTAAPDTVAPDTTAPLPRTAHPVPSGDSTAPVVSTTAVPTAVRTAIPYVVRTWSTTIPTAVPTPPRTSVPTEPNNATAFDETDVTDAPTTAAPEKDSIGIPWWAWMMIGLGTLLVLWGGVLLSFCENGTVDSRHIQAETDHEASELFCLGVDEEPQLAC